MNHFRLLVLAIIASLFFVACSDDDEIEQFDPNTPTLEDGARDVLGGYNCIIFPVDSISDIVLHTKRPVRLNFKKHPLVDFIVEKVEGRQVLRPILRAKIKNEDLPISVKVDIDIFRNEELAEKTTEAEKFHKTCYVVLRPSSIKSSPSDIDYVGGYIGKGTQLHKDFGNATYPILDFNLFKSKMGNAETPQKESFYIETCGKRYAETLDAIAGGYNLSARALKAKKKGIFFSSSSSLNVSNTTVNISEYEFLAAVYSVNMSEVKLDPMNLLPTGENCTDIGYTAYLTSNINDMLNNPGSPSYAQYGNDSTSIYAMLDKYGTHIITKATFGGSFTSLYGREASVYSSSVGVQFTGSVQGSKPVQTDAGMKPWVSVYTRRTGSPNIGGNVNINSSSEDLDEATSAVTKVTQRGGSPATDLDSWVEKFSASNKSDWVPVHFGTKDSGDPMLIPLYDPNLCLDEERRAALEKYIPLYLDKHAAVETEMTGMKVVDFCMHTGANDHASNEPKPFVARDPWGVKRIYYPMMANSNAPKDHGYALETSGDDFFILLDGIDHYWYYALAHDSDKRSKGIVDVMFSDVMPSGYTYSKVGVDANTCSGGSLRKAYPMLKLATNDPEYLYIRAIGLTVTKSPHDKNNMLTIASTAGSEMKLPFSTEADEFNELWNVYSDRVLISASNYAMDSFYDGRGWVTHHWKFRPSYITKNIFVVDDLLYGETANKPKFVHPVTWGEQPY